METTNNSTDNSSLTFLTTQQEIDFIVNQNLKLNLLSISNNLNDKLSDFIKDYLRFNDKKDDMFYEGCLSITKNTIEYLEELRQVITDTYKINVK